MRTTTQPSAAESIAHELEPELRLRLHRIARRILGCDHLAEDAVQETLIALWRESESPAHLAAWLATAVLHRSLHLRRTLRRRARHEHEAASRCFVHGECDNPFHVAVAHELAADIEHACRSARCIRGSRARARRCVGSSISPSDVRGLVRLGASPRTIRRG